MISFTLFQTSLPHSYANSTNKSHSTRLSCHNLTPLSEEDFRNWTILLNTKFFLSHSWIQITISLNRYATSSKIPFQHLYPWPLINLMDCLEKLLLIPYVIEHPHQVTRIIQGSLIYFRWWSTCNPDLHRIHHNICKTTSFPQYRLVVL